MAQNITLMGASYPDVPSVLLPKTGGGTATFTDVGDTTATAADVAQGTYFYTAAGVRTAGTSQGGDEGSAYQDENGYIVLGDGESSAPQGTLSITQNGTYDVADYAIAVVAVPSGGGGGNWTLLATQEFAVSTSSTSNTSVGTINLSLDDGYADPQTVLWVHVRDKAGKRAGYFYGGDAIFFHYQLANGSTSAISTRPVATFRSDSSTGNYDGGATAYGVYAYSLYYNESNHYVNIYSRYSSTSGAIDGTYKVDVYKLTMPSGMTLFETD